MGLRRFLGKLLGRDTSDPEEPYHYLKPTSWEGDDGLHGRGYRVYHTSNPDNYRGWHDLRPQGKSWRSTFYATKVAGLSHRPREAQRPEFDPGSGIALVPDPDNPYSESGKAVQVWDAARKYQAGFIPEEDAPRIFDRLVSGDRVWGFVLTEYREAGERVGLEILLVPLGTPLHLPPEVDGPDPESTEGV